MAHEINVTSFEVSARKVNKRNLSRSYASMANRPGEYINGLPLGFTNQFVLEVIIDKAFVIKFQDFLKRRNYTIVGKSNSFFIGKLLEDYEGKKKFYPNLEPQIEAISKDYELMTKQRRKYEEMENEDVKFYFLPYNDTVTNLCEFVEKEKESILKYATKNDITILMNIYGFSKQIQGFLGFNFIDEDNENDTVGYQSSIFVTVDFNQAISVYTASVLLSEITTDYDDLELMGVHILTE